jgi:hypothetical protein
LAPRSSPSAKICSWSQPSIFWPCARAQRVDCTPLQRGWAAQRAFLFAAAKCKRPSDAVRLLRLCLSVRGVRFSILVVGGFAAGCDTGSHEPDEARGRRCEGAASNRMAGKRAPACQTPQEAAQSVQRGDFEFHFKVLEAAETAAHGRHRVCGTVDRGGIARSDELAVNRARTARLD